MKNTTILAGILLVAVICVSCDDMGSFTEVLKSCREKFDITEAEHLKAAESLDYSDPKFHCLSECVMTTFGVMRDHEIFIEKVKLVFKEIVPSASDAELEKMHEICMAEAQKKEDKCEFAQEYEICSMKTILPKKE